MNSRRSGGRTDGERSAPLDALRVFAMLAIVAGHVWVHGPVRPFLYSWHVPVFFVLSGYLWKPGRSFGREVNSRFWSLLVPYAVWLLILGAVAAAIEISHGGFGSTRLMHILWGGDLATGRPFWAMWFVTALFFAAIVYWPMSRLSLAWQWVIAAVLVVAAVYIPGRPARFLPLSLGLALPGIVFMVAGRTLRRIRGDVRSPALTGAALVMGSFVLVALGWSEPLDVKQLDVGTPVVSMAVAIAISVGFILLAEAALADVPGVAGRLLGAATPLAMASLTVLFIHPALITIVQSFGLPRYLVFVVTVGVAWTIGLLLMRIPHSRALTGLKPPRRSEATP